MLGLDRSVSDFGLSAQQKHDSIKATRVNPIDRTGLWLLITI